MRPLLLAATLLALSASGCTMPWQPEVGPIVGKVVYPSGLPASTALVQVLGGHTTFTSFDGSFYLSVPAHAETVTVAAREYWGTYAVIHSGSVRVPVPQGSVRVRIVLSEESPI